jgi:hypothetical protein
LGCLPGYWSNYKSGNYPAQDGNDQRCTYSNCKNWDHYSFASKIWDQSWTHASNEELNVLESNNKKYMISFELDNQLLVPSAYASADIGMDFAWTLNNWKITVTMASFDLGTDSARARFKLIDHLNDPYDAT